METIWLSNVQIRPAVKNDLAKISSWEMYCFHESSLNAAGLLEWWKAYSNGVHLLTINNELAGAIGIWPIRESIFNQLLAGNIQETEIHYKDIITTEECSRVKQSYWYFGSIILVSHYKNKGLSKVLVHRAIGEWTIKGNLAESVNLCAIAYTKEGARLLEKYGFRLNTEKRGLILSIFPE